MTGTGLVGTMAGMPGSAVHDVHFNADAARQIENRPHVTCNRCGTKLQRVAKRSEVVDWSKQIYYADGCTCGPCENAIRQEGEAERRRLATPPADRVESRPAEISVDTVFKNDRPVKRRLVIRDAATGQRIHSGELPLK